MTRLYSSLIALLCCITLLDCSSVPATPEPASPAADSSNRVFDAKTQKPVTSFKLTFVRVQPMADEELVELGSVDVSDRAGRFQLAPPADASAILVSSPGYLPELVSLTLEPDKIGAPLQISLDPGTTVRGKVAGAGGAPLAGVEVSYPLRQLYIARPQPMSAQTDPSGEFVIQAAEGDQTFTFTKQGFISETATVKVASAPVRLDQTLMAAVRASGKVVDDLGNSLGGVRVRASTSTPRSDSKDAVTDQGGNFDLFPLRPVEYKFEASSRGHVTSSITAKPPASDLTLVLPRGATVRGKVTRSSGEERPFVVVYIGPATTGINNLEEFGLLGIPAGTLPAYAEFQAAGKLRRSNVKPIKTTPGGETRVELAFTDAPVLRGRVLEGDKGVERALVTLRSEGSYPKVSFVTDENGAFEVIGIPRGQYTIEVRERELISSASHRQEQSSTLDITVKPAPPRRRDLARPAPSTP